MKRKTKQKGGSHQLGVFSTSEDSVDQNLCREFILSMHQKTTIIKKISV
jgi:hypothetical protein